MATTRHDFTPFIPDEHTLGSSDLLDKALRLATTSAKLAGLVAPEAKNTIISHMAVINSYYSNLIEGNSTKPHEIRAAQRGDLSGDPAKRDLQLESLAHIEVQKWLGSQALDESTLFDPDFIRQIHKEFYKHVPESLWDVKDDDGNVVDVVVPGEWRTKNVIVGKHVPPDAKDIQALMEGFCDVYRLDKFRGDKKVIAIMCSHHRLGWIHPFVDGNGRVMRLFADAAFKVVGMESYGIWCLSRGLARSSSQYKVQLERADFKRQSDRDGRGQLSQKSLVEFCDFMLVTAQDQVDYISDLLDLRSMQVRIKSYVQARNDGRISGHGKIKDVAALILFNAFISGKIERQAALELTGAADRTARRLLSQLKDDGLLSETSMKSPLYWQIPDHAEPWYFPNITPESIV